MTFMSQSLNAIPSPKPLELNEIPSPKELDLNEIRIPSSSSSSSGAHPFRGENNIIIDCPYFGSKVDQKLTSI